MSVDDRLLYETRTRKRWAVIAALAGVMLMAAAIIDGVGPTPKVSELTIDLINAHKRFPLDIVAAVINGLGVAAVAATLTFLFGATRARNPQVPAFVRSITIAGGVVSAVAGIAYAIVIAIKANQFVSSGPETYVQANHLTSGGLVATLPLISLLGALLFAISFVLVSLNGMRVGLLTRFHGYLGIFAGILVLFQVFQVPIVQVYWLLALAYLIWGRWPSGVPPAWRSGKMEPWPSGQQLREQRIRTAGGARGKPAPTPAPETVSTSAPMRTRASTSKRKRKKRR